jgi:hypothetical protein
MQAESETPPEGFDYAEAKRQNQPDRAEQEQEMKRIAFYGASDDLVEVVGDVPGCDEYNAELAAFVVAGLRVVVSYGARGTWGIKVAQIDESVPVTAFDLRLGAYTDYSMRLDMKVPAGTVITREAP